MKKAKSEPKKAITKFVKNLKIRGLLPIGLVIILLFLIILTFQVIVADKFYPFTYVGNINLSLLTPGQAIRKIDNVFSKRASEKLQFNYQNHNFTIDLATSSASIDYNQVSEDFKNQRAGRFAKDLRIQLDNLLYTQEINPQVNLSLDEQFEKIDKAIKKEPKNAEVIFDETNIEIIEGVEGLSLDEENLAKNIQSYLLTEEYQNTLTTKITPPKVTTEHAKAAKETLLQIQKQPLKLTFEENIYTLDTKQLLTLLDLTEGKSLLDKDKAYIYINKISKELDQEVQEGLFEFNSQTKRVTAFKPSQEGRKLDQDKTYTLLTEALKNNTKEVPLPVEVVKPKIQTADVNNLGIQELLGQGVSHFAGSIPNRIYNVGLTASKINGVLIPPGEIFSFNKTVGDISAATGFKQAYVIKEGRTVLDDGGGVCQDSTTLFRAVLNAGLPVVKRTAHAYRVGYYEQGFPPGLDATVYYPSVDFQFKNDTKNHILVQAYTAGTTLYVDLYGTSDGRKVLLTTPVVTDRTPAPPELRQDDPTLPKGTIKQVDWAAAGARVSFTRNVVRGGETILKETWNSNYKPWQAIFLVGTKEN